MRLFLFKLKASLRKGNIHLYFRCTLPCLGVQEDLENGLCETTRLPFERFVSRDCQLAYFKGEEETLEEAIDGRCQPCQVVLDGSSSSSTSENENNDEAATTLEETPSPSAKTHRNQDTQTDPFHQLEPILTSTKEDEPSRQESSSPRHYRISDKNQVDSFEISKSPDAAPKTVDGELVTVVTNSLNHESANDDDEISLPPPIPSAVWLKAESTDASGLFVAKKSIPTHDEGSPNNSENNHSEDDPAEISAENERREKIQFKSCRYCERSFNTRSACFSHERRVHYAGNFKCSECDHVASTISDLIVHFSSDHPLGKKKKKRF